MTFKIIGKINKRIKVSAHNKRSPQSPLNLATEKGGYHRNTSLQIWIAKPFKI